jgi:hypothetical protein
VRESERERERERAHEIGRNRGSRERKRSYEKDERELGDRLPKSKVLIEFLFV